MFYVSATDLFYTNWDYGKGKIVKIVFLCDTIEEALDLAHNERLRQDRADIKISCLRPKYKKNKYLIDLRGKTEKWFREGGMMEDIKPIAIMYCGGVGYALELYKIEYGIEDHLIVKFTEKKKKRRLKVYIDRGGRGYIKINNVKYYIDEFIKID